jgi:tetratricopeptide (TPR) repeat protein
MRKRSRIGKDFEKPTFGKGGEGGFRNLKRSCLLLLQLTVTFSLLYGCSFPRIVILKDPLTPEEHINLGVAYEKKGEFDNAVKEYELAAKKLPVAYFYLGNVYFQKNQWNEAEEHYRKALKKDPRNSDAHNNLAWLYYTERKNLEEAEKLALKAIELNPSKELTYKDTLDKIRELKKSSQ